MRSTDSKVACYAISRALRRDVCSELQQHVQNHSLDPDCSLINATLVGPALARAGRLLQVLVADTEYAGGRRLAGATGGVQGTHCRETRPAEDPVTPWRARQQPIWNEACECCPEDHCSSCAILACTDPFLCHAGQIAESFRRYGVSPDTKDLLVCRFDMQPGEVCLTFTSIDLFGFMISWPETSSNHGHCLQEEAILQVVQGQLEPLSSLGNLTDMDTLQKASYRILRRLPVLKECKR